MSVIKNPIIPGMAPDPSILRVGEDYYIATSTFHWKPAIQIFHSRDLANWQLLTYALDDEEVDLQGTNTPAGIWAPHLSYDKQTGKYWLAFCHIQNMAGREFNAESYIMSADQVTGPWTKPAYLTSIGFDPSLFHDEDGKHYAAVLEWETREDYQAPGHIVIAEVDLPSGRVHEWHRVTTGFTTRGCVEAPQIYQHGGYYYLLLASGGTGYAHGVEIGRSKEIFGPYEPNPTGEPIITSSPHHLFSLGDPDAGHFEMYNPHSKLQKSGHGSLVETPDGRWYMAHLTSRPLPGQKLNPLGRETALQEMRWTQEGWLELADGSNLAKETVTVPGTVKQDRQAVDVEDHFAADHYDHRFMTPYHGQSSDWVTVQDGHLLISGRNSLFSQVAPSIMGTRATSLHYDLQTKVTFHPDHYSETAGVGLYYDANNWFYVRLVQADNERETVLRVLQAKQGQRIDDYLDEVPVPDESVEVRLRYDEGQVVVAYRFTSQDEWQQLGGRYDLAYLSDEGVNGEPGEIGGFTGLFNFIGAVDAYQHQSAGKFAYYSVHNRD